MLMKPRVLLITLGGTITMTRSAAGGIAPTLTAVDLVHAVAGIEKIAEIDTVSPLTIPGASLSIDDVLRVATLADQRLASDVNGVVVIQGTDTIEETAFLLDLVIQSDRPVVVTGAMRGPQAPGADGPANVLAATIVAAHPASGGLGTLVVLNDEIHLARFVQKSHTALPSAFTSPFGGTLGIVVEGRPLIPSRPVGRPAPISTVTPSDVPVALVKICLGDDGRVLRQVAGDLSRSHESVPRAQKQVALEQFTLRGLDGACERQAKRRTVGVGRRRRLQVDPLNRNESKCVATWLSDH